MISDKDTKATETSQAPEQTGTLAEAIKNDNFREVQSLISNGVDVDQIPEPNYYTDQFRYDKKGYTPLQRALERGHLNIAEFLIQSKADVNKSTKIYGTTPLSVAILRRNIAAVDILLRNGADINGFGKWSKTPLMLVAGGEVDVSHPDEVDISSLEQSIQIHKKRCEEYLEEKLKELKYVDMVQSLINTWGKKPIVTITENVDVNDVNKQVELVVTTFIKTIKQEEYFKKQIQESKYVDAIEILFDRLKRMPLITVNAKDAEVNMEELITEIEKTIKNNVKEIIKPLYREEEDKIFVTSYKAARSKDEELAKLLIDNNADVNKQLNLVNSVDAGDTALALAAWGSPGVTWKYTDIKIIELFIQKEAKIDAIAQCGYTALMCASQANRVDVMQLLYDHGADVNKVGLAGHTALSLAASQGNIEAVIWLVEHGADPNAKSIHGRTVLYCAANGYDTMQVVEYLLQLTGDKKVNVNKTGLEGTPLMAALNKCSHNNFSVFHRLINHDEVQVHQQDDYGNTVLITAVTSLAFHYKADMIIDIVRKIIEKAEKTLDQESFQKFIDAIGRDFRSTTISIGSALMFAAQQGYSEVVKLLLEKGASLDIKNTNNETALELAQKNGYGEIIALLQVEDKEEVTATDEHNKVSTSSPRLRL